MEWLKIPTDSILYSEFKDEELIILIKYQALYCQLESEPTLAQMSRVFSKKEIKFLQNFSEIVKNLCENQIKTVSKKRNRDKESYKKKQSLSENSASGKLSESQLKVVEPTPQIRIDKIREDKKKNKQKEKISFSDVFDWDSLFQYWEENKKGGMYKNDESRQRMLGRLRELTNNDFDLAKLSICHAIDNKYQGFCNGGELFYKPPKGKPPELSEEQRQRESAERLKLIQLNWKD
jgi:hypothetical protein